MNHDILKPVLFDLVPLLYDKKNNFLFIYMYYICIYF